MLHSEMKWSCFILLRHRLRRDKSEKAFLWSAPVGAWSTASPYEAARCAMKRSHFRLHFFVLNKKNSKPKFWVLFRTKMVEVEQIWLMTSLRSKWQKGFKFDDHFVSEKYSQKFSVKQKTLVACQLFGNLRCSKLPFSKKLNGLCRDMPRSQLRHNYPALLDANLITAFNQGI